MPLTLISLFLLFLLPSCSEIPTSRLVIKSGWIVRNKTLDEQEARKIIANKSNFLRLTFELFVDPKFNTEKWSHSCRDSNVIGEMKEESRYLLTVSTLYTDKEFHTGFCSNHPGARSSQFVYLYCRDSKKFFEIRCESSECGNLHWQKSC